MRQEFIQFNHTKSFLAQTKYEEGGHPLSSSQGGRGLAHKERKKKLFWFFPTFCALIHHNYINLKTPVRLTNVFILCLG
jgi:hypothetical protein